MTKPVLKLERFHVWYRPADAAPDSEPLYAEVTIEQRDMVTGELRGARMMLPGIKKAPITGATLWCWAALVRMSLYDGDPMAFATEGGCVHTEAIDDDSEDQEVPPTKEPSGSASTSPATTATPPSGSTPS